MEVQVWGLAFTGFSGFLLAGLSSRSMGIDNINKQLSPTTSSQAAEADEVTEAFVFLDLAEKASKDVASENADEKHSMEKEPYICQLAIVRQKTVNRLFIHRSYMLNGSWFFLGMFLVVLAIFKIIANVISSKAVEDIDDLCSYKKAEENIADYRSENDQRKQLEQQKYALSGFCREFAMSL